MKQNSMKIIGLTGGIASGKSTISKMLADMGFSIIDCDYIIKNIIYKDSNVLQKVKENFGGTVFNEDNTINYAKLGNIVFNDDNKLDTLNKITHTAIKIVIRNELNSLANKNTKLCFIDDPLLFESKYSDDLNIVDKILLVYVDENTQIKRLMNRNKISREEAILRIRAQMPLSKKREYADFIIDNTSDIAYSKKQLIDILKMLES